MKLFAAWVHDLAAPFDRSLHCDPATPTFSMRLTQIEDAYPTLEISRVQSGWAFLSPSQPKNVLVSWSFTGSQADAVLLARGRVRERPRDLLGSRQTILLECAPSDIDDRILAHAKGQKLETPVVDFLFADADVNDRQAYLLGTPEVWHVDPATHAIRTVHLTKGDRVIDLRDTAFFQDGKASDGAGNDSGRLARTIRQRLVCEWTQTADGQCDVGSEFVGMQTLDPNFFDRLSSALETEGTEGWSIAEGGVQCSISTSATDMRYTGTDYFSSVFDEATQSRVGRQYALRGAVKIHRLKTCSFPLRYEYSQDRREVVFGSIDLPVLDTGIDYGGVEESEVSLKDIFTDPLATPYAVGTQYKKGDRVRYNGRSYTCRADHTASDFRQLMATTMSNEIPVFAGTNWGLIRPFAVDQTYWEPVLSDSVVPLSANSFFATQRGQLAIRHLVLRMRRAGILSLRDSRIAMKLAWADGHALTRADAVRILVPDGAGGTTEVVGKILQLTHEWPEGAPPFVGIEIGVSFGTALAESETDSYGDDGYSVGGYVAGDAELPGDAGRDTVFATQLDPVRTPVTVGFLSAPFYSVQTKFTGGEVREQLAAFQSIAGAHGDVLQCSQVRPTWARIRMRSLASVDTLVREIDVAAELKGAEQGVTI